MKVPDIPGYRIVRELARGGMARVYLAYGEKMEREVALKVLRRTYAEEDTVTRRFLQEARTAANLRHTHIVPIYDVGQVGDTYYFTMEYLEGSLRERLGTEPRPSEDEALPVIRQIAAALDYAHRQGVIHRDIKPGNILFRKDNSPVLVDFGIARAIDSPTRLTRTGTSMGTAYYMSPEQIQGEELDGRTDIYSLGVVLYEMLSGQVPYDGSGAISISIKHLQEPIPRLPDHLSRYQPLVDGMLAKEREERIQGAGELIHWIDQYIHTHGTVSIPAPVKPIKVRPRRGRAAKKPTMFWRLISVLLILGFIGLWLFVGNRDLVKRGDTAFGEAARVAPSESSPQTAGKAEETAERQPPPKTTAPDSQQQRKEAHDRHLKLARDLLKAGNLAEARQQVVLARDAMDSLEAAGLEREIEDRITHRQEQARLAAEQRQQADDQAFRSAVSVGTIRGYEAYIDKFPDGQHLAAARQKIDELTGEPPSFQRVIARALKLYKNDKGFWEAIFYTDIVMVYIPAGPFQMGTDGDEADRRPVHTVSLDGYWIGKYEVTFDQYDRFCQADGREKPRDRGWGRVSRPVICISWNSALDYCRWLSRTTGLAFDLPTEAQWEKAARASRGGTYPWGGTAADASRANADGSDDGYAYTAPVGSFPGGASPYGLLDMAGNVWEWCRDWYGENYYSVSPSKNPPGPAVGTARLVRGGSWKHRERYLTSTCRGRSNPSSRDPYTGFRLVLTTPPD